MSHTINLIQAARVASPCDVKWDDMVGDDLMRHCGQCQLNVYNFRNMTKAQANELLGNADGRICGQLWRRADGTVITSDCPGGMAAIRRRVFATVAKIVAAAVMLCTAVAWGRARDTDGRYQRQTVYGRTTDRVETWLNGPPPRLTTPSQIIEGGMIMVKPVQCIYETNNGDR